MRESPETARWCVRDARQRNHQVPCHSLSAVLVNAASDQGLP
jgi:hypothetical protein